jgi:hypothetical protein
LARSRIVLWGGAALVVLAGIAVAFWRVRDRGGLGAGRSGGPAVDAGGARTGRDGARAAIRDGRLDEAWASYRGLDASAFEAEDFSALGSVLLERDRRVLGWAALEAARRIDPRHGPTNRALEGLQAKLAAGREQAALRDASETVEFLRGVRGGPPLGLLVLGLARFAGDPDHEQDLLDRLMVRDRSVMRAVATTGDALKLVARLLMETGRAAEADDMLRPLVADRPQGKDSTPDREAAWLLSRAALQLDRHEAADAMLALAAGFGTGDKPSLEPAPYIGSRRCAACHAGIFRAQQEESAHAKTLYLGAGLKGVPLPAQPVPDPVAPGIIHRFWRSADDRIELESRDKDRAVRAVIEYAVGSGRHGITMVGKDEPTGIDRELRVSYFSTNQTWGETKGINYLPHEPGEYIGLGLGTRGLQKCLHCHTTWFRAAEPIPSLPRGPEALDRGIGCERCHGPGLNHDKAVASGFADLAIGRTRHTPPRQLLRSCDECHGSNSSVEPSDPEFTRVQTTTLMFSRCFTATDGGIHCATCHDPHRDLDTNPSHYDVKCLGCHGSPAPTAGSRAAPSAHHGAVCPINATADCTSCHMPKVQDPSRRTRFTEHHIRVHRPAGK